MTAIQSAGSKRTENELLIKATETGIQLGPQVGETYMFRTLSLYWIGTVLAVGQEWILLAPGSVQVVLSVGGDLDEVHLQGKVDSRPSPVWCQLNRSGILEFSPVSFGMKA